MTVPKTTRKFIAVFLTLSFIVSFLPLSRNVRADGDNLYGIFNLDFDTGSGELRADTEGEGLCGYFVQGGSYTVPADSQLMIVANNASISGSLDAFGNCVLLGSSTYVSGGYQVSSAMPAYTGEPDLSDATAAFMDIVTHIFSNNEEEEYTVTVIEDMVIDQDTDWTNGENNPVGKGVEELVVAEGVTLTVAEGVTIRAAAITADGQIIGSEGSCIVIGEDTYMWDTASNEWGNGEAGFTGIEVWIDEGHIAGVQYSLNGGSDYTDLPDDRRIASDLLTDDSQAVTFKVIPQENDREGNFELGYIDGPDLDTDDQSWEWTTAAPDEGAEDIVFTIGREKITKDLFIASLYMIDGGHGGIEVRFDDNRISGIQYSTDGGNNFIPVVEGGIPAEDIPEECTAIVFEVLPKEGEENRNYVLSYVDGPDYEVPEEEWNWTELEPDTGSEGITFTISRTLITNESFCLDIHDTGENIEPGTVGIEVRFDDSVIQNVSYSADGGNTYEELPGERFIEKADLPDGFNEIIFKIETGEDSAGGEYVLSYVDGPDLEAPEEEWTWTDIGPDEGTDDIKFTISAGSMAADLFVCDIHKTEVPESSFVIRTVIAGGRGTINLAAEDVQVGYNRVDENTEEYMISCDDYDKVSVEFEAHADDVYVYEVGNITVTGITEDQYTIEGNVITLTSEPEDSDPDVMITVEIEFCLPAGEKLSEVEEHSFAYYSENYKNNPAGFTAVRDEIRRYTAVEIYNYYCHNTANDHIGMLNDNYADIDEVDENLISATVIGSDSDTGLPFIDFMLRLGEEMSAPFRVYILSSPTDFIVKSLQSEDPDVYAYDVVTAPATEGQGEDVIVRRYFVPGSFPQAFGNGIEIVGAVLSDSKDIMSCHATQERSNILSEGSGTIGAINSRLIVIAASDDASALRVYGDKTCGGWEFDKIDTFTANADAGSATDAYIYIGSTEVFIDTVRYFNGEPSDKVLGVEIGGPEGLKDRVAVESAGDGIFKLTFATNYDLIPLTVKFESGEKLINLHRVALRIDRADGADDGYVINGRYFYAEQGDAEGIKLFATITYTDGSSEMKEITTSNNGCEQDPDIRPGKDQYYSTYTLWEGSKAEYANVRSVQVIVSRTGTGDRFGGVMVGSGQGVLWTPDKAV